MTVPGYGPDELVGGLDEDGVVRVYIESPNGLQLRFIYDADAGVWQEITSQPAANNVATALSQIFLPGVY